MGLSLFNQIIKSARAFEQETGKLPTRLHISEYATERLKSELKWNDEITKVNTFYGMTIEIESKIDGQLYYLTK